MPASTRSITIESAHRFIRERSFPRTTGDLVGVELEWFTTPSSSPPDVPKLTQLLQGLTLEGSALTFEPGGQVELSSFPFGSCDEACDAISRDRDVLVRELAKHGVGILAAGLDPDRPQQLLTDVPRYVAMRRYFDTYGAAGGRMMCASAAIHVNLDAGSDDEGTRRWRTAHLAGPMLLAAFANSPFDETGPTGWKSTRARAWQTIDPSRTQAAGIDGDPTHLWAHYALDARVMFIRSETFSPLSEPLTFREWIDHGHPLGHPTEDDLAYHLTTLFPPVRPHGHLELRMMDMLPDPWWRVAVAITTALVCDREAQEAVAEYCSATADSWQLAARCALEDPPLATAAAACIPVAVEALARTGCDGPTKADAEEFVERFTRAARCPADEAFPSIHAEVS